MEELENKELLQTEETAQSAEAAARQTTEYMGTEKVSRLLIKFGLPAIATILVNAMYNMVDRIFVSNGVGYIGLSAISITSPVTYVMAALAMLIGVGGHTIFAMRLGEKDYDGAEEVLGNTLAAMFAMCVLKFVVAFALLAPILTLLGASGEMLTLGEQYMRIILCGTFFSAISYGMNNFVNTSGNPMRGMINLIVGCVVNIVFDALFILVFHWGVRGAALATIMGQFASAFMVLSYFTVNKKPPVHFHWKRLRIHWALTVKSMKLGIASALSQATSSIVTALINWSVVHYGASGPVSGEIVLSSVSATTSTGMVFVIPAFGLQQAVQSLAGYNFGAKNYQRVKDIVRVGMIMCLIVTIPGYIILHLFSPFFVSLYGNADNQTFVDYAVWTMHVYNLTVPVLALHAICTGYFLASGQALKATIVSMARSIIGLVPLTLILPLFLGVNGCIWAVPAADLLGFAVAVFFMIRDMRRLTGLIHKQERLPDPA